MKLLFYSQMGINALHLGINLKFPNMLSVRFFLADPKAVKCSIYVIVLSDGSRYKKGIKVSVETKYWNVQQQRCSVSQKYREGASVNFDVERWRNAIHRVFEQIPKSGITVNTSSYLWELVECEINNKPYPIIVNKTLLFTDYFENTFIEKFQGTKSENRITRFSVALAKVKAFESYSKKQFTFDEINTEFYRAFNAYMMELKHSVNYFGSMIKIIKQVMNEACMVDKLHNNQEYSAANFKACSAEVDTVYLTREELDRIITTPIDDRFLDVFYSRSLSYGRESLRKSYTIVKNRFLIGAFTGLRMSDFNRLATDNIRDGKITVVTQKTNQKIVIPVHPVVQSIIDSGFDFAQSLSDQKTRTYIKHICKYVNIDEPVEVRDNSTRKVATFAKWELVSSHTARRSFATNAYKAGVPSISIMKITGHTSERTFMKYIRISSEENADILSGHEFFK